ncbi:FecR domain-containing protein [Acidovorax sp. GBBC 3334]|uniref:FecR domain-containing protein n=1 Tax=Acidovorax sp. GBBC 3334 TaxID=2940496 RepID=UPI002303DDFC|nr:FecR domain-containing protein [Acidovorax sp. GBBC 3334]MDA8454169.1 FecR domain-containing protein [Acidovorax sp. GBBC 3334]
MTPSRPEPASPPGHGPDDRRALREAAAWHTRLREGAGPADAREWQRWLAAHPAHQRAWERVQAVSAQLAQIPAPLARQALGPPAAADGARRTLLRGTGAVLGAGAAAWVGWSALPWREWQATHRTARGERRALPLPDGSELALDTATAVDVAFDAKTRELRLHAGRILVATHADPLRRPFRVHTPHGEVLALGTRFSVQADGGTTRVAVQEKAVRLLPAHGAPAELGAGEQATFTAMGASSAASADPSAASWRDGGLIALDMPLGRLVQELARYRPGLLLCAPEIAALRVSGAFPLDDTDRALAALAAAFPVQVRYRTRYWVRVEPA